MDWLRRNWPDLLIGIALIAVIAGIVATLLTGGSFFPLGTGSQTSAPSTPNVAPADPGPTPIAVPETTPSAGEPEIVTPSTPGAPGASGATPGAAESQPGGGAIAVLPPASGESGTESASPTTGGGSSVPLPGAGTATGSGATAAPATQAESVQPSSPSTTPSAPSSISAPTAPYRVSVGAFGSEANAETLAQTFRDAGYPVFLGRQGDLVLVLVGPYDTQGEAEQAVARIRGGDFGIDPVIYRFQPDEAPADADANPASPETAASPAAQARDGAQTPPAPEASEDGTFLQIGAYANRESALPQIQRLEALGFDVTELTESGLVKLLVGPYGPDALEQARTRLSDEGIEHFPR